MEQHDFGVHGGVAKHVNCALRKLPICNCVNSTPHIVLAKLYACHALLNYTALGGRL